jgi:hypothetical protein
VWCKETVSHKKKLLASLLKAPLAQLVDHAYAQWDNTEQLNQTLQASLCKLPHCQLLYAIATTGVQLSANITRHSVDNTWRGQDLSARPYLQGLLPFKGMTLSAAYLSQRSMQPCITALQAVIKHDQLLGFIAADFHIKDLPNMSGTPLQRMQQLRTDSSLAGKQTYKTHDLGSADQRIDSLLQVLATLMQEHGVFHSTLHFDSACVSLWSLADPLDYQVYSVEEVLKPELFLHYPKRSYERPGQLAHDKIPQVLSQLKALRQSDDTVYLRSGSVNIINGRIGLTFSCDDTQYMYAEEFLNHELTHWLDHDNLSNKITNPTTPN